MTSPQIAILIGYFLLIIVFMLWLRRAKSFTDYSVASRNIPGLIIFATLSANFIGPGYSLGLSSKGFDSGFAWLFIFSAFSIQTILVGLFIAPKLRNFNKAFTVGDVIGYRYGLLAKMITGVISVLFCAGIVGVVARAAGSTMNVFLDIPLVYGAIITTAFVITYSTFGGIKADIFSDVIQFIIFAITVPLLIFIIISHVDTSAIISKLPSDYKNFWGSFTPLVFGATFLGFLLGETLVPPYFNRGLAAKDSKNAKIGFVLSGVFSFIWFFVLISVGVLGRGILNIDNGENVFWVMSQQYLPAGLVALMIAAMASIIMSTQDSFLNSASVSFVNDFVKSFSKWKNINDRKTLISAKTVNVIIGIFGVIFALFIPGLVEALLYCYTLWAPTVVLPLIIGTLKKDVHPRSGLYAIIGGGIVTAIWEWGLGNPNGIPSLLIGVITNQLVFWITHFAYKNSKKELGYWVRPISEE